MPHCNEKNPFAEQKFFLAPLFCFSYKHAHESMLYFIKEKTGTMQLLKPDHRGISLSGTHNHVAMQGFVLSKEQDQRALTALKQATGQSKNSDHPTVQAGATFFSLSPHDSDQNFYHGVSSIPPLLKQAVPGITNNMRIGADERQNGCGPTNHGEASIFMNKPAIYGFSFIGAAIDKFPCPDCSKLFAFNQTQAIFLPRSAFNNKTDDWLVHSLSRQQDRQTNISEQWISSSILLNAGITVFKQTEDGQGFERAFFSPTRERFADPRWLSSLKELRSTDDIQLITRVKKMEQESYLTRYGHDDTAIIAVGRHAKNGQYYRIRATDTIPPGFSLNSKSCQEWFEQLESEHFNLRISALAVAIMKAHKAGLQIDRVYCSRPPPPKDLVDALRAGVTHFILPKERIDGDTPGHVALKQLQSLGIMEYREAKNKPPMAYVEKQILRI